MEYRSSPSPHVFDGKNSSPHGIWHKVKPQETLYHISRQHHIPLGSLLCVNPYVDVYNLKPQDEVFVPLSKQQPL